ncbi:ROK family glucokinase [Salicibibacter cibarius]|uniref:Glucokinase n=1 Tax=Salicibibacter cibarius TaxID=2743000 RepID=A0A7T7CCW6_9BACI|nr:ROK family glucokinase [Salicibibacter cibarius]QQK77345.1 ROK family glucokinase [Salicibibacter cibarius]
MSKYVVGIDVGGTSTKFGLFMTDGEKIDKWKIATDSEDNGKHLTGHIIKSIKERFVEHSISEGRLTGIGIGVPGFVDEATGVVDIAVNIGWENYPLKAILADAFHVPVFINNDANLAAAGEHWQGAGKKEASSFFVTLGTGVGGGIIVNGDLVTGLNGTAGEIGHTVTVPHGRLCTCGREGCLEEYVAAKGLRRSLRDYLRNFKDSRSLHKDSEVIDIYEAAKAGDALAAYIVNEAAYYLAYALANAVTLINPEKIIIGGGMSAAGETLLHPLVDHYKRFVLKEADESLSFEFARLGNDAGIYGATWLVLKRLGYFE